MPDAHLLIVEDDLPLAELMANALRKEGYRVDLEHDGAAAEGTIRRIRPDLIVLDVMLPGRDGFEICRSLKPDWEGPILMLTAREEDFDQVLGLELGAEDYVVKPVVPRVLSARIKALLRRTQGHGRATGALRFGKLQILPGAREVRVDDVTVPLTSAEFDLLHLLARRAGQIVTRDDLFRELRGIAYDGQDRSMDLRISKVRSQLRERLGGRSPIRTVRGQGYLFATSP